LNRNKSKRKKKKSKKKKERERDRRFEFDERPWGLKWLYSLTRFGFLTDEPNGDATSG
jgi:hypothetical protein